MRDHGNTFYPSRNLDVGLREDQRCFLETAVSSLGLPSLFYASLREPRVFETVTGRPMNTLDWKRVGIRGFQLGIVNAGSGFPGIFPAADPADAELEGLITRGLSQFERIMVAWYEWDEYLLRRISLADGRSAQVFVPNLEAIRREYGPFNIEPWSFKAWRSRHVDRAVVNAREWMAHRPSDAALVRAGFITAAESPANGRASG